MKWKDAAALIAEKKHHLIRKLVIITGKVLSDTEIKILKYCSIHDVVTRTSETETIVCMTLTIWH